MKVVFFGLGSIGRRHAGILRDHFKHELFAFRPKERAGNPLGLREIGSWEELEELRPDAAFITNPTFLHVATASRCAALGMHLFIEKPLSHSLAGVPELIEAVRKKDLSAYVAYNMRFNPVIKKMKDFLAGRRILHARVSCSSYLPHWRPGIDHLKSYSASAAAGGGVLLDLSHEFDYLTHLFGPFESMAGKYGRAGGVTVDAEDYADIAAATKGGAAVNLHLDCMSRFRERRIVVDYEGGYCVGDLIENGFLYEEEGKREQSVFEADRDSVYLEQAKYFFDKLGGPGMDNELTAASALLEKILEFKNG